MISHETQHENVSSEAKKVFKKLKKVPIIHVDQSQTIQTHCKDQVGCRRKKQHNRRTLHLTSMHAYVEARYSGQHGEEVPETNRFHMQMPVYGMYGSWHNNSNNNSGGYEYFHRLQNPSRLHLCIAKSAYILNPGYAHVCSSCRISYTLCGVFTILIYRLW